MNLNCVKSVSKNPVNGIHLFLRNNIYYARIPIKNSEYKRISLKTDSYTYAWRKIMEIMVDQEKVIERIKFLLSNLKFVGFDHPVYSNGQFYSMYNYPKHLRLAEDNDVCLVQEALDISYSAEHVVSLNAKDKELLENMVSIRPLLEDFVAILKENKLNMVRTFINTPESYKISEVLDTMIKRQNNSENVGIRKRLAIIKMLEAVELNVDSEYAAFHDIKIINKLSTYINSQKIKDDQKRRLVQYLTELITVASDSYPDYFKPNLAKNLPLIKKSKRSDHDGHIPFTKEELLKIFDPKYDHFKKHPDALFACMEALFTGSRTNASITLQYDDVKEIDGIWCIEYRENHEIKNFNNDATERVVPIHPQLIKAGFLDYINRKRKVLKPKGTDFIIPEVLTRSNNYNNHFMAHRLFGFLESIGVKERKGDYHDFHSFRNNASLALQDAGIGLSYINNIIGWTGDSMMERHYSKHTLAQIKTEYEKFRYDFLEPYFAEWRKFFNTVEIKAPKKGKKKEQDQS